MASNHHSSSCVSDALTTWFTDLWAADLISAVVILGVAFLIHVLDGFQLFLV